MLTESLQACLVQLTQIDTNEKWSTRSSFQGRV